MNGSNFLCIVLNNLRFSLWNKGFRYNLKDSLIKGQYGEWLALKYLKKKGYFFLSKNWRSKKNNKLEIDLIFKDQEILVFVEVRARSTSNLVTGYESINYKKKQTLKRAFMAYLREEKNIPANYRFDVIEIDLPDDNSSDKFIYHHENIAIF